MNYFIEMGKPIWESGLYDNETIVQLWDFYVTHGATAGINKRDIKDYSPLQASYDNLIKLAHANIQDCIVLKADSMYNTLVNLGFYERNKNGEPKPCKTIDIDKVRWCMLQNYEIRDFEEPRAKKGEAGCGCLFRHIRNALAHSSVSVFSNSNVLLFEKSHNGPTAYMLVNGKTLVDWVKYVDIDSKYYFKNDSRLEIKDYLGLEVKTK